MVEYWSELKDHNGAAADSSFQISQTPDELRSNCGTNGGTILGIKRKAPDSSDEDRDDGTG